MEEKDVKKEEEKKVTEAKPVEAKKEEKEAKTEVKEKKEEKAKTEKEKTENPKTEKSKSEKTSESKSNNSEFIVAIVIIALIVIALIMYMFFMVDSPKKAVEDMFNQIKTGAEDQEMFDGIFGNNETMENDVREAIFSNLSWNILSEKEEGDKATVEVEVTNKDFKKAIENFKEKIVKVAFSGEEIDEAKTQQYLIDELNNKELENVKNTHTINVEKKDGKWEVSIEENEIVNILLPGFMEAIQAIN